MSEGDRNRRARLRWVTLGEAIAVAAVMISALTLYLGWQDRRQDRADKAAEAARTTAPEPFALRATMAREGASLAIAAVADTQVIQTQTIRFPPALQLQPVVTNGDPRIEASWFASSLKAARRKRDLPGDTRGDARLPVMIETDYLARDRVSTARAYYDVGYVLEGRLLGGRTLRLRGLSLIGQAPSGTAAADRRLSTLWAARD